MEYTLLKATDNAQGQFDSNIGPSTLSIVLGTGEGALFPEIIRDSATSTGDESTLNSTGIGASGIEVGDFIENLTDGSHAYVISISTNSVQTTTLQGGTANIWDNADEWVVGRFEVTLNSRNVTSGAIEAYEVVRVSDRSGDTLTVETGDRGMRSTTAQSWDAGDYVNLFVGAEQMEGIYKGLAEMALDINSLQSTKADVTYVDAALASRNWKQHVVAASTANVTLASGVENGDTLDGVTLATGDRILLKDQTTTSENGIYVVAASGAPTRATDFDTASEVTSALVAVRGGTTNADSVWLCTSDAPAVGTDPIVFSSFTPASVASQAEAEAGTSNTKMMTPLRTAQAIAAQRVFGGDGSDGDLAISSNTTLNPSYKIFNYNDVTIDAGFTLKFGSNFQNKVVYMRVRGDLTINGTLSLQGLGSTGGNGGTNGNNGTSASAIHTDCLDATAHHGLLGTHGSPGSGGSAPAGLTTTGIASIYCTQKQKIIYVIPGCGGGGGAGGTGNVSGATAGGVGGTSTASPTAGGTGGTGNPGYGGGGGGGGAGGGALVLEVLGNITLGGSHLIDCSGQDGANGGPGGNVSGTNHGGGGGGAGGGGSGGMAYIIYSGTLTGTPNIDISGGNGGTGGNSGTGTGGAGTSYGGGGGSGGGGYSGAGGGGGASSTAGSGGSGGGGGGGGNGSAISDTGDAGGAGNGSSGIYIIEKNAIMG